MAPADWHRGRDRLTEQSFVEPHQEGVLDCVVARSKDEHLIKVDAITLLFKHMMLDAYMELSGNTLKKVVQQHLEMKFGSRDECADSITLDVVSI